MAYNIADLFEHTVDAVPNRTALICGDTRLTFAELDERANRFGHFLQSRGVRPGDHVGIYAVNSEPWVTAMLGCVKIRAVPVNVNYRYVEAELAYLIGNADLVACVFDQEYAPRLAAVAADAPKLRTLVHIADGSGADTSALGSTDFDDACAEGSPERDFEDRSDDDVYIIYTGGTTGMPKGVMWRQDDIFVAAMGGRRPGDQQEWASYEDLAANALNGGVKILPGPPFMHGAAHWVAFNSFANGNTVVLPSVTERLDVDDLLATVAAEGVNVVLIVGDAFGRPLVEGIEAAVAAGTPDLSSLLAIASGGAALSSGVKSRLLAALPSIIVMDGLGASETGQQGTQLTTAGQEASTGDFTPGPGMCILSEDLDRVLEPGHDELGWLGQSGRVPLGYLGDEAKTARTFPVIDGTRYAVPGDRARLGEDGRLELFGRDSVTINSGGEKIFAEEVEQALLHHPAVRDCVVAGRPSERWGHEVVALVVVDPDAEPVGDDELLTEAARHIARYKLPKAVLRRDALQRSPSGKADYRWAAEQATRLVTDGAGS